MGEKRFIYTGEKKQTEDYIEIYTEIIQCLYWIVMDDCCLHLPPPRNRFFVCSVLF